jgi:hypothetical protein
MDAATTAALAEESAKRSGLLWVRRTDDRPDAAPARPVWHVWHEGSAYLLTGGAEQPAPEGLDTDGARAEVTARSKDKGCRLLVWQATVQLVEAGTAHWDAVLPALAARRLNSPDGDQAPLRWARECRLLRLTPAD